MADTVTTEEQAIKLAELFIDVAEEYHALMWEEHSKRTGKEISYDKMIYKLQKITLHPKGWILEYRRSIENATVDPPEEYISVNKETGETKFGDFAK